MWNKVNTLRSLFGPVRQIFLLDTSWLLYRYYYSHKHLGCDVGNVNVRTGDIYGILNQIYLITKGWPYAAVIMCVDSKENDRKEIYPEYKSQREEHPEVYAKLPEVLQTAQLLPNVYMAGAKGKEADDLMFSLAKAIGGKPTDQKKAMMAYIYTRDQDLFQAVSAYVKVFHVFEKKRPKNPTGVEGVIEKFGVVPEKLAFFRAIDGDDNDNLKKPYPRFPKKLSVKLVNAYGSPQDLVDTMTEDVMKALYGKSEWKWIKKIQSDPESLYLNFKLMQLKVLPEPHIYKCEGSWTPLQKYSMRATETHLKELLEEVRPLKGDSSLS